MSPTRTTVPEDFCATLRAHGFDDLVDLYDDGFNTFSYVRELQRAFALTLYRVASVDALHKPYRRPDSGEPYVCESCDDADVWPCPTRQALDGMP